jgi:hypothetical protein
MRLDEAIEKIEARKNMWKEFAKRIDQYILGKGEYPYDLLQKLGEGFTYLFTDYGSERDGALYMADELEWVLELLKEVKREDRFDRYLDSVGL